jgi:hypothetical protein
VTKSIFIIFIGFFLSACSTVEINTEIEPPQSFSESLSRNNTNGIVEDILEIRERNRTVEDEPQWIEKSYDRLRIKNIRKIRESDYKKYSQYVDQGSVYVIVHPAFYVFFHKERDDQGRNSSHNAVDHFISVPSYSSNTGFIKHQEKALRDFLEYMSTKKKLVILLLPRKYWKYEGYNYKGGPNEYKRYINEVSNGSESVLYLYTKKANSGSLSRKNLERLLDFLYTIGAQEILLGGGYLGRCVSGFYRKFQTYSDISVNLVPELIQLSPEDMGFFLGSNLLNGDGTVNSAPFMSYIQEMVYDEGFEGQLGLENLDVDAWGEDEIEHQSSLSGYIPERGL